MPAHELREIVSTILRNCYCISKIPSQERYLFVLEAALARDNLCSYSDVNLLRFMNHELLGESNSREVPILIRKLLQFKTQILPFMVTFPRAYRKVFESLLSVQEEWFRGWEKMEEAFIVYGDMVGFSRSAQKHNFHAAINILAFRYAFFRGFKDCGGYLEASGGDSILGVFKDGEKAVSAAIEVLKLARRFGIGARIGISFGDYLSNGEGRPIIGASINTAVRVADGGSKKGVGEPSYKYLILNCDNFKDCNPFNNNTDLNLGIWLSWNAAVEITNQKEVNPSEENAKKILHILQNEEVKWMNPFLVSRRLKGVNDGLSKGNTNLFFGLLPKEDE